MSLFGTIVAVGAMTIAAVGTTMIVLAIGALVYGVARAAIRFVRRRQDCLARRVLG